MQQCRLIFSSQFYFLVMYTPLYLDAPLTRFITWQTFFFFLYTPCFSFFSFFFNNTLRSVIILMCKVTRYIRERVSQPEFYDHTKLNTPRKLPPETHSLASRIIFYSFFPFIYLFSFFFSLYFFFFSFYDFLLLPSHSTLYLILFFIELYFFLLYFLSFFLYFISLRFFTFYPRVLILL